MEMAETGETGGMVETGSGSRRDLSVVNVHARMKLIGLLAIPYSQDYKYPSIIRTPQIQVPI